MLPAVIVPGVQASDALAGSVVIRLVQVGLHEQLDLVTRAGENLPPRFAEMDHALRIVE